MFFLVVVLIPQLLYTSVIASGQAMSDQEQSDTETKPKVIVLHGFHTVLSLLVGSETWASRDIYLNVALNILLFYMLCGSQLA